MKFTGTITHLSQKGHGVVRNEQNNMSYFVPGTWPGDVGEFEVIDRPLNNKKFAYAKLTRLTHPSGQRQHPACPYLNLKEDTCTGCPWMIADYASQLEQKRKRFLYAMKRGGFDTNFLKSTPIQPAPQVFGYRNRCQLKTDGVKLGFVSENSGEIVPVNDCIVLNDACRKLLNAAIKCLPHNVWQLECEHDWCYIDLDDAMQTGDIRINYKRAFRQGNTQQNKWIQEWLRKKLAQIPRPGKVVELFCGSGNFTQIIAESGCSAIFACESDSNAIRLLKARNLARVNAQVVDLFRPFIWKTLRKDVRDADTLILDPPRAGLKKLQGFFESFRALKTIVYISCNPETFARDAWIFTRHGWILDETQLVDMFPHTPHIEVLGIFSKK